MKDLTGIGAAVTGVKDILGMFFPDKTDEEKAKIAQAFAVIQGQLDTNKAEAASSSAFVAGWRPFVGWVCGTGFAVQFVIGPMAEWGAELAGHPVKFPQMDMATMMPLLFGMLGLGAYRTAEKIKGAEGNR